MGWRKTGTRQRSSTSWPTVSFLELRDVAIRCHHRALGSSAAGCSRISSRGRRSCHRAFLTASRRRVRRAAQSLSAGSNSRNDSPRRLHWRMYAPIVLGLKLSRRSFQQRRKLAQERSSPVHSPKASSRGGRSRTRAFLRKNLGEGPEIDIDPTRPRPTPLPPYACRARSASASSSPRLPSKLEHAQEPASSSGTPGVRCQREGAWAVLTGADSLGNRSNTADLP